MVTSTVRKRAKPRSTATHRGASKMAKSTAAKANLALKLARSLVKDVESKTHTFTLNQSPVLAAQVFHITNIAKGDDSNTRVGVDLNLKSFEWRFIVNWNTNDTVTQFQNVRLTMFRDKQQSPDVIPSAASLYGAATVHTVDLFNPFTVPSRYDIIQDRIYTIHQSNQTSSGNPGNGQGVAVQYQKWSFPLKHKVRYNGDLAGDIQRNGIYIAISSVSTLNPPTLTSEGRFHFTG